MAGCGFPHSKNTIMTAKKLDQQMHDAITEWLRNHTITKCPAGSAEGTSNWASQKADPPKKRGGKKKVGGDEHPDEC